MQSTNFDHDILIIKYLEYETTDDENTEMYNWVYASEENKNHFIEMARSWEKSTILLQDKKMAEDRLETFFRQINATKRRTLVKWLTASGAAVVLLFICLKLLTPFIDINSKVLMVNTGNTKKEFLLPDGSKVWLNANSSLKYTKNKTRNAFVTGEAYFDIKKDISKPFLVIANHLTVEVLGTKFLVTAHENRSTTEAILESGKIKLTINESGEIIEMFPNQKVVFDKKGGTIEKSLVDASIYTGWHLNRLVFENTTLDEVFIQLEKWYNVNIICNNDSLKSFPMSFTVDNESLDYILNILQPIASFSWYKSDGNTITIQ